LAVGVGWGEVGCTVWGISVCGVVATEKRWMYPEAVMSDGASVDCQGAAEEGEKRREEIVEDDVKAKVKFIAASDRAQYSGCRLVWY
jgi:hypothetical protein